MDEFDQTAEQQVVPAGIPAEARAEGHEQRTDAFPAAAQNVGGDGVDQGHPGIEILLDLLLDALEFLTIGFPHISHRVDSQGSRSVRHAADSRAGRALKSSRTSHRHDRNLDTFTRHPVR